MKSTSTTTENPSGASQNTTSSAPSYADSLAKTSSKIKDTKEFEECMQPSVNMCINQVGNQLARAQKSTAFCMEMPDAAGQDACKFGVVMTQVAETKDAKLCDSLTDSYKQNCKSSLILQEAMSSGDTTKCDGLKDPSEATVSGDLSPGMDRVEQCKSDIIIRKQDSKLSDCDNLKKGQSQDMCRAILKNRIEWERILQEGPAIANPNAQ